MNYSDNETNTGYNTTTFVLDNTAPTIRFVSMNVTNLQRGQNSTLIITVNDTSYIKKVNITIYHFASNTTVECNSTTYAGASNTGNPKHFNMSCIFNSADNNLGGDYMMYAYANDTTAGGTEIPSSPLTANPAPIVYNGYPYNPNNVTGSYTIAVNNFGQLRTSYTVPIPVFQNNDMRVNASEGKEAMPMFFGYANGTFVDAVMNASVQENLAYWYNFTIDNMTTGTLYNISINLGGSIPALYKNMSFYTPEGLKTQEMISPEMNGNEITGFYVYTNHTGSMRFYVSNVSLNNAVQNVSGYAGFSNAGPYVNITLNSTTNTALKIALLLVSRTPINLTGQNVSGFDPQFGPPGFGSAVDTTYNVSLKMANGYLSPSNISLMFMFPKNVTMYNYTGDGTDLTQRISTEVILKTWNGTGWATIAYNTTASSANVTLVDFCFNTTDRVSGSPMENKTMRPCMWGFKYRVSQNSTNADTPIARTNGTEIVLSAYASLNFSLGSEAGTNMVPGGTCPAGSTCTYRVLLNLPQKSGLNLSSRLPSVGPGVTINALTANGQTVDYTLGSLIVSGTSLQAGSNDVLVTYSVPAATTNTVGGGGGGGGGTGGTTAGESHSYSVIYADQEKEMDLSQYSNHSIAAIFVQPTEEITTRTTVTVTSLGTAQPTSVSETPVGTLYKYVQITINLPDTKVADAKIKFVVEKSWLTANNLADTQVVLARWSDGVWTQLQTSKVNDDETYVYYEAATPGFSIFAITTKTIETCVATCPTGQSQRAYPDCTCYAPQCTTTCGTGELQRAYPDCGCYVAPSGQTCTTGCASGESQKAYPDCGCYTPAVVGAAPDYMTYVIVAGIVIGVLVVVFLFKPEVLHLKKR